MKLNLVARQDRLWPPRALASLKGLHLSGHLRDRAETAPEWSTEVIKGRSRNLERLAQTRTEPVEVKPHRNTKDNCYNVTSGGINDVAEGTDGIDSTKGKDNVGIWGQAHAMSDLCDWNAGTGKRHDCVGKAARETSPQILLPAAYNEAICISCTFELWIVVRELGRMIGGDKFGSG